MTTNPKGYLSFIQNNKIWFLVVSFLVIGLAFYFFSNIITYVLIAFVLSLVGQPIMRFFLNRLKLGRWRWGSPVASLLTILIFFVIIFLFGWLFVPTIISQAMLLAEIDYAVLSQTLDVPLRAFEDYLISMGADIEPQSSEEIIRVFIGGLFDPAKVTEFFSSILGMASNVIMAIFSIAFISFFFLQEKGLFQNFILTLVPSRYEQQVKSVMDSTINLLTRYFSGIFLQVLVITTYVWLALTLFGLKYALLIGFFAAIVNVIPYIGPIIGASFGILVTITGNTDAAFYSELMPQLFTLVIIFASMQLIDNFILQPVIFSRSVKAHPLEIFMVILIAGRLGGVLGMVLAIPVYTMLRVVAGVFLGEFKIVQRLTREIQEVDDKPDALI